VNALAKAASLQGQEIIKGTTTCVEAKKDVPLVAFDPERSLKEENRKR